MIPNTDTDIDHSEHSQLATDLVFSIEDFGEELEQSGETADDADMTAMGLPPIGMTQVLEMLGPAIAKKTTADPNRAKRALALIHLETGALLEEHADQTPEDLLR